jgi:hypothetical protein
MVATERNHEFVRHLIVSNLAPEALDRNRTGAA